MLKSKLYNLQSNTILTQEVLSAYITNFWNDVFTKLHKDSNPKYLMILCKIEFTDLSLGYRTIGYLRKVNFSDKEMYINYIQERLGLLTDAYTTHPISKVLFTYMVRDGITETNLLDTSINIEIKTHRFNNVQLPISMDPLDYGKLIDKIEHDGFVRYITKLDNKIYQIDVNNNGKGNIVKILLGASDLSWTDTLVNDFIIMREIKKSTIYFMDGELILRKQILPAKPYLK